MTAWLAQHYLALRLVHIGSVILWSASALGAFWFVIAAALERRRAPDDPEVQRRARWVRLQFARAVILEHVAFVVLVPTGLMLALVLHLGLSPPWFAYKLAIVLGVFVPIEVLDVWLSHWRLPRALARGDEAPDDLARVERWHDLFLWIAGAVVAVLIPIVLWLIVTKPSL